VWFERPGHTYGGFSSALLELGFDSDDVCFLYDLPNGMTLTQEIVASLIFPITEILGIEDNELHDTFLLVAFGSQRRLRITSDQTYSDTNWRTKGVTGGGGERELEKILFINWHMSLNQNPRQPLCSKVMKALSNSRNMIPTKLWRQQKKNGINRTYG
jgi:hypothetical protein